MDGRADLVNEYVGAAGFESVGTVREQPGRGSDPFYAVVARRSEDPKKPGERRPNGNS
jgi:hypothetical protein